MDLPADPAVIEFPDGGEHRIGQRRQLGRDGVLPGLLRVAGTRDHRGHAGLLDDPAQGGLGRRDPVGHQRGELARGRHAGRVVDPAEGLPT